MIVIDTTSFADGISKAARVAPTNGDRVDQYAGIRLVSNGERFTVEATDIDTTFRQRLYTVEEEPFEARLPSTVLDTWSKRLPNDAEMTLELDDTTVKLTCGKQYLNLATIEGDYPGIPTIPNDAVRLVEDFGDAVNRVSWAAERDSNHAPLDGVAFDGTNTYAVDKGGHVMSVFPLEMDIDSPIVAPLSSVAPAMGRTMDVSIGATENRLLIKTDTDTEITSILYQADQYPLPTLQAYAKKAREGTSGGIVVDRKELDKMISQLDVVATRLEVRAVHLRSEGNALFLEARESGFGDVGAELALLESDGDVEFALQVSTLRSLCRAASEDTLRFTNAGHASIWSVTDGTPGWGSVVAGVRVS